MGLKAPKLPPNPSEERSICRSPVIGRLLPRG
jgi:hypothetical protein